MTTSALHALPFGFPLKPCCHVPRELDKIDVVVSGAGKSRRYKIQKAGVRTFSITVR